MTGNALKYRIKSYFSKKIQELFANVDFFLYLCSGLCVHALCVRTGTRNCTEDAHELTCKSIYSCTQIHTQLVMEDFRTLCQHRRSIRTYTDQPVEREKIDYILQCALMAPSGKRLTPWEFVVVTDEQVLRQFAGAKTYGSQMFNTAMAGIVVALDASLTDTWQADGAIAAEHILLAAEEQGLGACWCHIYGRAESEAMVRDLTGIPEAYNVLCVISLYSQ